MSDVALTIDGGEVTVAAGTTILEACGGRGCGIPTLCYGDTITPKNACRVCMVEVEGSSVLVPSCSRKVEPGMVVTTRSERVVTIIPGSTLREHDGTSTREPSTSTMHTRQAFLGVIVSP